MERAPDPRSGSGPGIGSNCVWTTSSVTRPTSTPTGCTCHPPGTGTTPSFESSPDPPSITSTRFRPPTRRASTGTTRTTTEWWRTRSSADSSAPSWSMTATPHRGSPSESWSSPTSPSTAPACGARVPPSGSQDGRVSSCWSTARPSPSCGRGPAPPNAGEWSTPAPLGICGWPSLAPPPPHSVSTQARSGPRRPTAWTCYRATGSTSGSWSATPTPRSPPRASPAAAWACPPATRAPKRSRLLPLPAPGPRP